MGKPLGVVGGKPYCKKERMETKCHNMDEKQMAYRCPEAQLLGTAEVEDYRLLFKGSKTGAYATIEPEVSGSPFKCLPEIWF